MSSPQNLSDRQKAKQAHVLLSRYERLYRQHGKQRRITFNRYSAKWGMMDVIDSVGVDRAAELLDFYFTTDNDHTIEFFYKNFDKLDRNEWRLREDRERRAKLRRETEQRIRETED